MISSSFLTAALAACLPLSRASITLGRTNITQSFKDSLSASAEIFFPSDPDFANETTQRWTVYDEPTYVAAIVPASSSDVQNIVRAFPSSNLQAVPNVVN